MPNSFDDDFLRFFDMSAAEMKLLARCSRQCLICYRIRVDFRSNVYETFRVFFRLQFAYATLLCALLLNPNHRNALEFGSSSSSSGGNNKITLSDNGSERLCMR
jgi:hypothetical protein